MAPGYSTSSRQEQDKRLLLHIPATKASKSKCVPCFRGLGFISPKQPAIQIAEEKIEREPKQGCIGKGDDKSTAPERIDHGLRRFMMRLAHGFI